MNVRWDLEEALSRLVGDAPAHAIAQGGRSMATALRGFIGRAQAEPVPPPDPPAGQAAP